MTTPQHTPNTALMDSRIPLEITRNVRLPDAAERSKGVSFTIDPSLYAERFLAKYPEVRTLLEAGGALEQGGVVNPHLRLLTEETAKKVIDFVMKEFTGDEKVKAALLLAVKDGYQNITEHCVAAALFAAPIVDALSKAIPGRESVILNAEQARYTIVSTGGHDANKPLETSRKGMKLIVDELGKVGKSDLVQEIRAQLGEPMWNGIQTPYGPEGYASTVQALKKLSQADGLEALDITARAKQVYASGAATGHNSFKDLVLPDAQGSFELRPGLLCEKIVHAADDCTSTPFWPYDKPRKDTEHLSPLARMGASDFDKRYPFMRTEGLAPEGDHVVVTKDLSSRPGAQSYMDLQAPITTAIATELRPLIDPRNELAQYSDAEFLVAFVKRAREQGFYETFLA